MSLKAAFLFLSPQADSSVHQHEIDAGNVCLTTIAVRNAEQACSIAEQLIEKRFNAVELCAGFTVHDAAKIRAVLPNDISLRWSRVL